jgi:hypothetical protein
MAITMSCPGESSSGTRPTTGNPDRQSSLASQAPPSAAQQEVAPPLDGVSLMNYEFTFEQNVDDAVTASFRIEADVCSSRVLTDIRLC